MHLVLSEFEKIKLLFQKETANHCIILEELRNFTLSMLRRILHPRYVNLESQLDIEAQYLSHEKIYFGYKFSNLLAHNLASHAISPKHGLALQNRCFRFLKRACRETLSRIP